MEPCPYCKNLIHPNDTYCPYCNKPLIVPINKNDDIPEQDSIDHEFLTLNQYLGNETIDFTIIKNDEIEAKIQGVELLINQKINNGESAAPELLEKASLYYKKRDLESTVKILHLALDNFVSENDQLNIAITHNELGIVQEELGYFDQAIYHFNYSIEILDKIQDIEKIIQVYNNLANVYFTLKEIGKAHEYYDKALELAIKFGYRSYEIKTSSNLIDIFFILKEYEKVQNILERNLIYFTEIDDSYGLINTRIKLGKLYYKKGPDFVEEALNNLNIALNLIKRINSGFSLILKAQLEWECFLYLGLIHNNLQAHSDAEHYLLKSLESIRTFEIGDDIREGRVLESLGVLYTNKKNYHRSIEFYELASEIFYKYGDDLKRADIMFIIGDIYYKTLHDTSKAIDSYNRALEIYEQKHYLKKSALILNLLGEIYIDEELIDLSMNYYEKARSYYHELLDEYNEKLITEKINSLTNSSEKV